MMIGVYNHLLRLLRKVFRFHYHSQKVIGSLGKQIRGFKESYATATLFHPHHSSINFLGVPVRTQRLKIERLEAIEILGSSKNNGNLNDFVQIPL